MPGSTANVIENIRGASDPCRSLPVFSPSFAAAYAASSLCPVIKSRFPAISIPVTVSRFTCSLSSRTFVRSFSMFFSRLYYEFVKTLGLVIPSIFFFFFTSDNTRRKMGFVVEKSRGNCPVDRFHSFSSLLFFAHRRKLMILI